MRYEKKDFALAKIYAAAVMSMNELYGAGLRPSGDMVADEVFAPPPLVPVPPERFGSWPETAARLREIYDGYTACRDERRVAYMREQILSLLALGRWIFQADDAPYTQKVADLLRVDPTPVTAPEIEADHRDLTALLTESGYRGDLPAQIRAWREDHLIPAPELAAAVAALLTEAKERALALGLTALREGAPEIVIVRGVAYQGYCDFDRRRVCLNGDISYTRPGLKRLICHETYPGHLAHMETRRALLLAEQIPLDAAFVVVCTASSPVFEGLADNSPDFIGWNDTGADRVNTLYEDIRAKACLTASYLLGEEGRDRGEVAAYLSRAAFADADWAQARLRLMSYPLRRPFLPAYWRGNEAVRALRLRTPESRKADLIRYLYENMHSVNSLRKFV
ncbi:MAG: hypothetical protein LBH21_04185 [Gracilibacteraceae bacterium]|jgi:hypothetical protein|nr:hypothetical protein [Gracilibacteraceae bacterium]